MYIREKKNASGTITIQMIEKRRRQNIILKTIGVGRREEEIELLKSRAKDYIRTLERERNKEQLQFLFMPEVRDGEVIEEFLKRERCEIRAVGSELILGKIFDEIGLNEIEEELFKDMVFCRIVYPTSKLKMIKYLWMYKHKKISATSIYRFWDKFYKNYQEQVQRIIYEHSVRIVKKLQVVFYDMTTLYFETEDEDDLRKIEFSKDGKFQCPQIMLGLLVT